MDRRQVMGVLAHEMAHVKNRDILIGSIAATLAGAITWLANMMQWGAMFGSGRNSDEEGGGSSAIGLLLMSIVAPFAAMIIQMAVSRSREYQADALGAQLAGEREGLASALERLGALSRRVPLDANPSTAHMFIVNPLSGRSLMSLFSTHPAIEERVARLRGGRIQPQSPTPSPPPVNKGSIEEEGRSFWNKLS
jgi:heat shock protein HtpX